MKQDLSEISLSDREARCLHAWEGMGEYCLNFRGVGRRCDIEPHNIRRVVRSLARKGLLEFHRGLFNEDDGTTAGSGYGLTPLGSDLIDARIETAMAETKKVAQP